MAREPYFHPTYILFLFFIHSFFLVFFSDFWIEKAVTRANKHNHSPRCAIYVTKHRRDLTRRNPFKNEYAKFISTIRFAQWGEILAEFASIGDSRV